MLRKRMVILKRIIFLLVLAYIFERCEMRSEQKRSSSKSRGKYKLYRIYPDNNSHLKFLKRWQQMAVNFEIDFWKEARFVGDFADAMVSPEMLKKIEKTLHEERIRYVVTVPDVQKLIERNEKRISYSKINRTSLSFGDWLKDDVLSDTSDTENGLEFNNQDIQLERERVYNLKSNYSFGDYKSYKEMLKFMRTIEFYYPNITKLVRVGKTHDNLPIEGIKLNLFFYKKLFWIGKPSNGTRKRGFWIDANIHAREWASSHTALYFINQLVGGYGKDPKITLYVDKLDFFIFPCLNPDGYEFSRSSSEPQVRLWRKNRSPAKCIQTYWGEHFCCSGVDLNRNFDFHWAEVGTSANPCSNIYHGENAFSEPETRAVKDFLTSVEMKNKLDGFITLHTYAQLWIHPFSHQADVYPDDVTDLTSTAKKATERLRSFYGTKYKIGTGANMLKPASGGSDDWAKSVLGVKYVYLVELRPEYELSNGFILNEDELLPTAIETWEGVKEVIDSVLVYRFSKSLNNYTERRLRRLFGIIKLPNEQTFMRNSHRETNTVSRIDVEVTTRPQLSEKVLFADVVK